MKPRVSRLYYYPFKALDGVRVETLKFDADGPLFDRLFMLVDEEGTFINQLSCPKLVLAKTILERQKLCVAIKNHGELQLPFDMPAGEKISATIYDTRMTVYSQSSQADKFFSEYLGMRCRVVRFYPDAPRERVGNTTKRPFRVKGADGHPVTILSEPAWYALNERLGDLERVPVENFRANIIVERCRAHEEDEWASVAGVDVKFWFEKKCERCSNITVNRIVGERPPRRHGEVPEPLRTLRAYRPKGEEGEVCFASKYSVELLRNTRCRLSQGEELTVSYAKTPLSA